MQIKETIGVKKQKHPSEAWSIEQKRSQLMMMKLASSPHVTLHTPTVGKLPTLAYVTPNNDPWVATLEPAIHKWMSDNALIPAICFKVNGSASRLLLVDIRQEAFYAILTDLLKKSSPLVKGVDVSLRVRISNSTWDTLCFRVDVNRCSIQEDPIPNLYTHHKDKQLRANFTTVKALTPILLDHQKMFLTILFLHVYWKIVRD